MHVLTRDHKAGLWHILTKFGTEIDTDLPPLPLTSDLTYGNTHKIVAAAILKIHFNGHNSSHKCINSHKIPLRTKDWCPVHRNCHKYGSTATSDGVKFHSGKKSNMAVAAILKVTLTTVTQLQLHVFMQTLAQTVKSTFRKQKYTQISLLRKCKTPFWKKQRINRHNLAVLWHILTKFGTEMDTDL